MKDIEQLGVTQPGNVPSVQRWSDEVEKAAQANAVMRNYVKVNEHLLNNPGDTLTLPKTTKISASEISADSTPDPKTFDYNTVDIKPKTYGAGAAIRKDAIQDTNVDILRDATDELGKGLAQKEDELIIGTVQQDSGGTVVAGSDFNVSAIEEAVGSVRQNDYNPDLMAINPQGEEKLGTIDAFLHAGKFGSDEVVQTGQIGRFYGMDVVSTTNCGTANSPGAGTAQYFVMDSKHAVAEAEQSRTEIEEDYNVMGQTHEILATQSYGIEMLNSDASCVIQVDLT